MSNPIKKVFKAVKKVFKAVTKIVKKILPVVLVAAAVYFGGYALANGTLTGSGTHLSSLITGNAGAGSSLFVPGANSAASKMVVKAGMKGVGQGWLGGSGFPGMGTQEGIATINTTTQTTMNVANSDAILKSAVNVPGSATGGYQPLPGTTPETIPGAQFTPTTPQAGVSPGQMTGLSAGELPAVNTPSPLLSGSAVDPQALLSPPTPPVTPTPKPGLLSRAGDALSSGWNSLGDYGKMAAVQGVTSATGGYFEGQAEQEKLDQQRAEEQAGRERMNGQRFGQYEYVPGRGIVYTPAYG